MQKHGKLILLAILVFASFLRLWRIWDVPVSLFGDELDVGYHAYSILKTGSDYYGNPWPIHFHSIAEWRTPLYLYSAVPTVAVFGITPLGVRLPAAIFGILSVWVMYLFVKEILSFRQVPATFHSRALLAAFLMAINPWSLQYSRAGFEVTLLLFLLLLGLYFFFRSLSNSKFLILTSIFLALTPWVYSTAKLFTPLLIIFLVFIFRKEIFEISKKYLVFALLSLAVVGLPIAVSTLLGGGAERFGYLSVFNNPNVESEIGTARGIDAAMRGDLGGGLNPTLFDRAIHNKFNFWGKNIVDNYFRAFSTDFLFVKGDINLRHSIGTGEFYKIESIALLLGLVFFFSKYPVSSIKYLVLFWILAGVVPASITRDGGNHATRLILILPPLVFLISYGLTETYKVLPKSYRLLLATSYLLLLATSFLSYIHRYYGHYPLESERWWHAGWGEAIASLTEIDKDYDRIVITMKDEPAWIFFAGWYEYPPDKWQKEFPIGNDVDLPGFGKVSHIDRFYFGSPDGGLYEWGQVLDIKTLYLASEKEVKVNLILEPERTPRDLNLIKAIPHASGQPAFYLFSGK